jgi:hypothetical protein
MISAPLPGFPNAAAAEGRLVRSQSGIDPMAWRKCTLATHLTKWKMEYRHRVDPIRKPKLQKRHIYSIIVSFIYYANTLASVIFTYVTKCVTNVWHVGRGERVVPKLGRKQNCSLIDLRDIWTCIATQAQRLATP